MRSCGSHFGSHFGSRRGGVLAWLLGIGLVFLCLMIAGGVFVARNIRVHTTARNGGDDVTIDTPVGHLSVHAHEKAGAVATGVPFYPGAWSPRKSGGDAVVEWTSNNAQSDRGFSVSASEMVTSDPVDKVVGFYRAQLPNWVMVKEIGGSVRLELQQGGYKRFVAIHERHDGTHIGVASVGEPASN